MRQLDRASSVCSSCDGACVCVCVCVCVCLRDESRCPDSFSRASWSKRGRMVTEEGMEVGMGGQGVCFDVRKAKQHTQIRKIGRAHV